MATRNDLRRLAERKIMSWMEDQTTAVGAYNNSVTAITLADGTALNGRMLLEVPATGEIMRVKSFVGNVATVLRGDQQTTAQAITDGMTVKIWPFWGWTDEEKNEAINQGIDFLWPDVWFPKTLVSATIANTKEFGLPVGATLVGEYLYEVEFMNDLGYYQPVYNWRLRNDSLIFDIVITEARSIRLQLCGRQPQLTDDVTALNSKLPEGVPDTIAAYAAKVLLENLLGARTRYVEYSASLNDRASTPDELQRQIYYFYNQAVLAKNKCFTPRPATYASVRRNR